MRLVTNEIKTYIDSGDILSAIIRAATDVEFMLFCKLYFEKRINIELIETWTLGKYIKWCLSLELIDKKWEAVLNKFKNLRNRIVHDRTFFDRLRKSSDTKKAEELINQVCEFINATEIDKGDEQELERAYGEFLRKHNKEFEF